MSTPIGLIEIILRDTLLPSDKTDAATIRAEMFDMIYNGKNPELLGKITQKFPKYIDFLASIDSGEYVLDIRVKPLIEVPWGSKPIHFTHTRGSQGEGFYLSVKAKRGAPMQIWETINVYSGEPWPSGYTHLGSWGEGGACITHVFYRIKEETE